MPIGGIKGYWKAGRGRRELILFSLILVLTLPQNGPHWQQQMAQIPALFHTPKMATLPESASSPSDYPDKRSVDLCMESSLHSSAPLIQASGF